MDIWRWVEELVHELIEDDNLRLARLILQIPHATCEDQHAEVDALVPEALALARDVNNPWLEIYLRHWHMQSRILHRHEVTDSLPEVVRLLERANRPDTRDCPQSVCVTQDLACAYADLDGPGYVVERLAVSRETLDRIDPSWPCFDCISGEHVQAILDSGEPATALAFIEEQTRAVSASDKARLGGNLIRARADALLALGRDAEALTVLEGWETAAEGSHRAVTRRIFLARALRRCARVPEALNALPALDEILDTPGLYQGWLTAYIELIDAGDIDNTWRVGRAQARIQQRWARNGALYLATWSAVDGARLALDRGAHEIAALFLRAAQAQVAQLRKPESLAAQIDQLRAALAADAPAGDADADPNIDSGDPDATEPVPDEPAALAAQLAELGGGNPARAAELTEDDDPERVLVHTRRLRQRWPDVDVLAARESSALAAAGWPRAALDVLNNHVADHPNAHVCAAILGSQLIALGQHDQLEALVDAILAGATAERARFGARTLLLLSLERRGEHARCIENLRELIDGPLDDPQRRSHAMMLARLERDHGDREAALAILDQLAVGDPGPQDWARMLTGTLLSRWDAVRDSLHRLDMDGDLAELGDPGQGPIDVPAGLCRLALDDDRGRPVTCFAERRGPVTARIVEIAGPERPEWYRDLYAFDPAPLDEPPTDPDAEEADSAAARQITCYRGIERLSAGGYRSHALDGAAPAPEQIEALQERLAAVDAVLQVRSGTDYQLQPDDPPGPLLGLYAHIAAPATLTDAALHALLRDETESWPHPMTWPTLAEALGDEDELARQSAIAERYRL